MLLAAGLAAVLLLLVVAAQLVVPRLRGGRPVGPASPEARGELLRNGLRAQATITDGAHHGGWARLRHLGLRRRPGERRVTTYIQRGARLLGRRGEPVTVLVDAARPHVYLIVA